MINELCQDGLDSLTHEWKRLKELPMDMNVYDTLVYEGYAERRIDNFEKPYKSYIFFRKAA